MRILIAVPCMDSVPVPYVESLLRLHKPQGTEIMHLPNSLVYIAREMMADYAVKNGFDYVFFIDSDMVLPQDALIRLLEAQKDVVGGLYFKRKPNHAPVVYSLCDPENPLNIKELENLNEGLIEVEAIGTGALLIKTDVFKSIYATQTPCFMPINGFGEDLSFCIRARQQNYKIYCDTSVKCGHIGTYIYTQSDYEGFS